MRRFRIPELSLAGIGLVLALCTAWTAHQATLGTAQLRANQAALQRVADIRTHISDLSSAARGYALTKDERYFEPARLATEAIDDDLRLLAGLLAGSRFADQLDGLEQDVRRGVDVNREIIAAREHDGLAGVLRLMRSGGTHHVQLVRADADALERDLRSVHLAMRHSRDGLITAVTVFGLGATILLAIALPLSVSSVRDRVTLRELRNTQARMIGAGALGTAVWDGKGHLVEANDEYLRLFGKARADVKRPLHWSDIVGAEHGHVANVGARDLGTTGICKPFLLRARGGAGAALVWSVVAKSREPRVVTWAIDMTAVLAETTAHARNASFHPLAAQVDNADPAPGTAVPAAEPARTAGHLEPRWAV
jgi:CHASE3 domain sensor protein